MKLTLYLLLRKLMYLFRGTGISKYHYVNKVSNFFLYNLKSNFVYRDGNKIFLDKYDENAYTDPKSDDSKNYDFLKNYVKKNDMVLDVGANIGIFTLYLKQLVGTDGKVFSFEPEPHNFELLQKNIKVNNLLNIVIENKAVCEKNKLVSLKYSDYLGFTKISKYDNTKNLIECVIL